MMNRRAIVLMAKMCLAYSAFGVAASQEWVASKLSSAGLRIDTAVVSTNVVSGITNIVITSPFRCADVPECKAIRLTVSPASYSQGDADVDRSAPYIICTIYDGSFSDGNSWFSFARGWELARNIELPQPVPTGVHVCQLDQDCNCVMAGNTRDSVEADLPDDYKDITLDQAKSVLKSPLDMIEDLDAWGSESWQSKVSVGNNVYYFVTDSPADGSKPRTFNVTAIGNTDAWAKCVESLCEQWNEYIAIVRKKYVDERICNAENPQHDWEATSCGSHSVSVCLNNSAHTKGSHQYPGASLDDTYHSCVCGLGQPKPHGELVASGSKTLTYNDDGKETGWRQTFVCPAGCGFSKPVVHLHHFTNCGTCDSDDGYDCDTVCTGCNGEHVFGEPTVTGVPEKDMCARCECTMCSGCDARPDDTDITKHAGWMPCSEDVEDDNDDGNAKGAHCQCECLAFGHNARTAHDYKKPAGMQNYQQIKDVNEAEFAETYHYQVLGKCSRCGQFKKQFDMHQWPSSPTEYKYVSDSVCAWLYECEKCPQKKREDEHGHALPQAPEVCLAEGATCVQKFKCGNCENYVIVNANHVLGAGCKCANGCGYQFAHDWQADACGNSKCSRCGVKDMSQPESHSGWTSAGASGHTCACGEQTNPHVLSVPTGDRTPTYNSAGKETGWTQDVACQEDCGYTTTKTHLHHFTNCGTCDKGDGCDTACTGCDGEHVFGDATATACAKCECTMCSGCAAHPPYTDITKHAGWHPCGEEDEEENDNADGKAKGAHCACQCLAWGHNAALDNVNPSEHDYQFPSGYAHYEQIRDASATDYAKTDHYELIGKCTRSGCGRWYKKRKPHEWPENPTRYKKVDDSTCRHYYACKKDGCGYEKDEDGAHSLVGDAVYEAVTVDDLPKCRQKRLCDNCKEYVTTDTRDHVKNTEDECKCANGCGYQFDHDDEIDACGNERCKHCGRSKYGQESHSGHKSGGTYSKDGHQCLCGRKPDVPHDFGQPVEVSRNGWEITYRVTCASCPYYYDDIVDTNPCNGGHVALDDACGCLCGYYSSTGRVASVKSLHHWSGVSMNGNPECICDCGNMHQFKDEDTLTKNKFPATTNCIQCANICWACRERDRDDRPVADEDHQKMNESEARGAARCGCKCGKVRSVMFEKFHYRNSTGIGGLPRCRCYGDDARASGAVAGSFHFLDASDCPQVCKQEVNGELHLAAAKEMANEPAFVPAEVKHHKKKETGNTCGCACGKYHTGNWSQWHGLADFHVLYSGCKCGCPSNKHFPIPKEGCTRLCDGNCTGLRTDEIWGQTAGALFNPEYHDPSDSDCRCRCNYFYGASAPDKFHSVPNSSTPCFCVGMHKHKFKTPREDCTKICKSCGNGHEFAVADESGEQKYGEHSWAYDECRCKCPKRQLWPTGHRFDQESCTCYCGDETRGHKWRKVSEDQVGTTTCGSCGNTITEYEITYQCQRSKCGETETGSRVEGHAADCGDDPGSGGDPEPNYCDVHGVWYTNECPYCKEEAGGGNGGGGNGGGTGGSGGYGDI